jgi:DNA-binding MarR family transcriptional regulator
MKKTTTSLEQRLVFRLQVLSRLSSSWLAQIYKPIFGLSVPQWHTLSIIGRFAPISPKNISDISTMNAFNVSRNLSKLEDQDWIFRQISSQDKRQNELTLTKSGQEVYDQIELIVQTLEEKLNEVLTDSERKNLGNILDKLEPHYREVVSSHSWADHLISKINDSKLK